MTVALAKGDESTSDSCGDYFDEWKDFKRRLEDIIDE